MPKKRRPGLFALTFAQYFKYRIGDRPLIAVLSKTRNDMIAYLIIFFTLAASVYYGLRAENAKGNRRP